MTPPRKPKRTPAVVRLLSEAKAPPQVSSQGSAAGPWSEIVVPTSHGRIAVRMGYGRGVPLIFLHGSSADKNVFRGQMGGSLGAACRMVALDLPGHGDSQDPVDPTRTCSIPGYADAVIEVLEHLDLSRFALVGWSLGGHVALELATRYPSILGVMLCGTLPIGDANVFAPQSGGHETDRHGAPNTARTRASAHRSGEHSPDQRTFVAKTVIPIAVVNGDDDPLVDVEELKRLHYSSLWYGRVHLIHRGGHAPFLTQRTKFDNVLARFIRSMQRRHTRASLGIDLHLSG